MRFIAILAIFFMLTGCGKQQDNIPTVVVNFHAPINDPRLLQLGAIGGAVQITGYGVAGLIIYHKPDNSYAAYDACSTVNPEKRCTVTIDDPNLTATDPCSGAKFSLYDGSPVKAPAKVSLRQYDVYISGYTLNVVN
ncbi:hypothetical protein GS399_00030 [Pedobacter sp. HMF7647]|uniref:Rieske domain-containing protein n=1 Tax=Hufsiella arboris TaxID=2695275 RepID=A0A7K1Y4J4_9SPHI|nr:hypothetical protein [Hufsiella arboris]MXV49340.1 hypothetical protein [Hufsiella arboris]